MKQLIIIGTLHCGITPNDELAQIIESYNPTQLMVEIQQKDIESGNLDNFPEEMTFAAEWAKENNIKLYGFDEDIKMMKDDYPKELEDEMIAKDKEIVSKYDWKDFNKDEFMNLLDEGMDGFIDYENSNLREQKMLGNILNNSVDEGNIVVLTGCYHLKFFGKMLPEAEFPFRQP